MSTTQINQDLIQWNAPALERTLLVDDLIDITSITSNRTKAIWSDFKRKLGIAAKWLAAGIMIGLIGGLGVLTFSTCAPAWALTASFVVIGLGAAIAAFGIYCALSFTAEWAYKSYYDLSPDFSPFPAHLKMGGGKTNSDALIYKGLAAILIQSYQGLPPEEMLKTPPDFIKDLDILSSISFNRSNGFASIYQKMKMQTLNLLVIKHS